MVLAVVEKRMQQISQDLAVMGKEMEDLSMSMSGENAEKARLYYELVGRVDTLEEELASAREAASGAEAKAAALAQLKDKLAASLKAKMQEQIEKQEQLEKEKKALEDRVKGMREGEGEAMKELSAQLAAAEEERGRAGVELEQTKVFA
jgi:DNA anti-recombination protein RmuC